MATTIVNKIVKLEKELKELTKEEKKLINKLEKIKNKKNEVEQKLNRILDAIKSVEETETEEVSSNIKDNYNERLGNDDNLI